MRHGSSVRAPLLAAAAVSVWVVGAFASHAACSGAQHSRIPTCPRQFGSGYSYVITPGCESLQCAGQVSVTEDLSGAFWILGDGNPELLVGIDSGSFPAYGYWVYTYPGYPAVINSSWVADLRMDSLCPDFGQDPQRCMAILLSDRHGIDGTGVFAALTDEPDDLGNYDFAQVGNIVLADVPRPFVSRTTRLPVCEGTATPCEAAGDCAPGTACVEGAGLRALLSLPSAAALGGIYSDLECRTPDELVLGYRIHRQVVPRGDPPPAEAALDAWEPVTDVIPEDAPLSIVLNCQEPFDVFLATSIVFEDGFETDYVSSPSLRIECAPNLAEPEPAGPRKPRSRERRRKH